MENFIGGTALKCFETMLSELATPLAYKASCLLKRGNFEDLMTLKVRPETYTCVKTLQQDLQVVSFFKKYNALPLRTSAQKAKVSMDKFWQTERECFVANKRLNPLLDDPYHYGSRISDFLSVWRKKIHRILGPAPSWDLVPGKFGSGATFSNKGNLTSVADKLSDNYTVTAIPRQLVQDWDQSAWSRYAACGVEPFMGFSDTASHPYYAIRDLNLVRGSRFTTVDKQWDTDRGICIEPSVNVFYQLGIGKVITRALSRAGLDKKSSQVAHRSLARLGSLTGAVATIDLSNASDTISEILIKLLLPHDWWTLLASVRCTHSLVKGRWVRLEKFSSMGNGFTFELETLVFYTLAKTVAELEGIREDPFTPGLTISAYGDDIIVPSSIASSMISSLKFFGFTINETKSFVKGPFRESCGGDYFRGFDVRPFYLKDELNENHRYIAAANGIRRTRIRACTIDPSSKLFLKTWRKILHELPRMVRLRCIGPECLGDIVIHDDRWVDKINPRNRNSIRYLRVWRPVTNRPLPVIHFRPGVQLAAKLLGDDQLSELETTVGAKYIDPFIPKINGSYVSGYKLGWTPYS